MANIISRNLRRAKTYVNLLRKTAEQVEQVNDEMQILNQRITRIDSRIDGIPDAPQKSENEEKISEASSVASGNMSKLELLEGTPYSAYALPIEYMPSRDFSPRWGYSREREPVLNGWFKEHVSEYSNFLKQMRVNALALSDIPLVFDAANLPSPAWSGVPYAPFDSVALYTMILNNKPKRYLEIGSGITTCFANRAIKDAKLDTTIISIDPDPRAEIDDICDTVIRDGLETCDLSIFDQLEAGDILFFDGSHRVFMNSDVTVFMIDILPRIKPGVIVHIHDINLPWDYPDSFKNWYWSEQYILAVYLMGNRDRITPLLPTTFVCRDESFSDEMSSPMLELGEFNDGWLGGGAMWFTHK